MQQVPKQINVKPSNKNERGKTDKKRQLSPYQQYLMKNPSYERYKQNYFNFYDDVKDKTHKIYDW